MTEILPLPEFQAWPKTARLNRDMIVTEKIDGTNAAVIVESAAGLGLPGNIEPGDTVEGFKYVELDGIGYIVGAQSRKKLISPGKQSDNYGFAQFVFDNADKFATALGLGVHFGEWYGQGIQSKYGLDEKRFMLFNTTRWGAGEVREYLKGLFDGRVEVATVLYQGPFDVTQVNEIVADLRESGSVHVEGFAKPEGVIVHNVASGVNFKVTTEKDESPKGVANA